MMKIILNGLTLDKEKLRHKSPSDYHKVDTPLITI